MVQLNLLPDLKKQFIEAQRARNRVISLSILVIIVTAGLTALMAFYVYGVQNVQVALVNNDIKSKTNQLKGKKDIDKYLTLQNQLETLPQLHTGKDIFSRLFEFLPVLNPAPPNGIQLVNMQVSDSQKQILFTGTAPSFQAFNVFKDTLTHTQVNYMAAGATDTTTEALFSTIAVQSASLGQSNGKSIVSFTVLTTYNANALVASSTNVKIAVPSIQNTGASGQTPVFNEGN